MRHLKYDTHYQQLQYIPRNMHMVFALLCFVVVIHWLIFPYPSGLLHWHCGNLTIAPVPAKQPWWIWMNTSCEFIMNGCVTTTKQSTTKPCAYFLGYTVCLPIMQPMSCFNIKTAFTIYELMHFDRLIFTIGNPVHKRQHIYIGTYPRPPPPPKAAKQPWWIWMNTSCEFIMNGCVTTTKQSTTKPCAYFLGYTVCLPIMQPMSCFNIKTAFTIYELMHFDRLIFTIGNPVHKRQHIYIGTYPRPPPPPIPQTLPSPPTPTPTPTPTHSRVNVSAFITHNFMVGRVL